MFKAFIVDDEPLARDELEYLLKRSKQVEIVGQGDSIESSLRQLQELPVDVIFWTSSWRMKAVWIWQKNHGP